MHQPVGGGDRYWLRRWLSARAAKGAGADALGASVLIGRPAAEAAAVFDSRHVAPIGVARRGTGKKAKLELVRSKQDGGWRAWRWPQTGVGRASLGEACCMQRRRITLAWPGDRRSRRALKTSCLKRATKS